jgi:hypothetical protein
MNLLSFSLVAGFAQIERHFNLGVIARSLARDMRVIGTAWNHSRPPRVRQTASKGCAGMILQATA